MNNDEKQQNYERAEKLLSEQNFIAAVIAGAVATLLAATAYAIVTAKWPFAYGFAAVGIGIVVGFTMQYLGRGIDTKFAVLASVYAIAGCLLGNVIRELLFQTYIGPRSLLDIMSDHIFSIAVVFWFVAVWFAVFLVTRPLSRSDKLAIGMYEMRD